MTYSIMLEGSGGVLETKSAEEALEKARGLASAGPGRVTVKKDGRTYSLDELERIAAE